MCVNSADTDLCSVNWMHIDHLQKSFNSPVTETVQWATANKLNEKKT